MPSMIWMAIRKRRRSRMSDRTPAGIARRKRFGVLIAALYVVASVLRLSGEETSGRAVPVLAVPSSLQLERLQWSLRHAYENVPHYRRAFDDVAIRGSVEFTVLFVVISTVFEIVLGLGVLSALLTVVRYRSRNTQKNPASSYSMSPREA